jgi:hypothetical protein
MDIESESIAYSVSGVDVVVAPAYSPRNTAVVFASRAAIIPMLLISTLNASSLNQT